MVAGAGQVQFALVSVVVEAGQGQFVEDRLGRGRMASVGHCQLAESFGAENFGRGQLTNVCQISEQLGSLRKIQAEGRCHSISRVAADAEQGQLTNAGKVSDVDIQGLSKLFEVSDTE